MFGISIGKRERFVAIADIAGGSVGFAIVEITAKNPATVLFAERVMLPVEQRSREASTARVASQIRASGEKLLSMFAKAHLGTSVGQIYCVIHAPWTSGQTVASHSVLDHEEPVRARMLGELAERALTGVAASGAGVLEASVVRVELNGYATGKPEGKRAHEITVTALVSMCEAAMRHSAEDALRALAPHAALVMRSSSRALLTALRELHLPKQYLIADISGDATTLIVFRDGVPREQELVDIGANGILERLSKGRLPEETQTLLRMSGRDQCETDACTKLMSDTAALEPELVRIFGEAMGKYSGVSRLPNDMLLATTPDLAPWLSRFFTRIDFTQFTQTAQPFAVTALASDMFGSFITPAPGAQFDEGLAVAATLAVIESAR